MLKKIAILPDISLEMTPAAHRTYLSFLTAIVVGVLIYLSFYGASYYNTSLEERFYHADHSDLKPNGLVGHGLGILGTFLIFVGVTIYMARKRIRRFSRIGVLKYWLEFHIFLCTLGPVLILFHTAFKFGGIVSIAFWSMVAVVASGVLGRFIYLQIPRTIQGRELSLQEVAELRDDAGSRVHSILASMPPSYATELRQKLEKASSSETNQGVLARIWSDQRLMSSIASGLKSADINKEDRSLLMRSVRDELALTRKISRLVAMQKYFRYWHIAHLPFAIIMLIIVIIHVAVTVAFGYKWIF